MISKFFKISSRSLEQFVLTVGQNNFGNKIPNSAPHITQSVQCSDFRESTGGSQCSVVVEFFMLDNLRNIRKNLFSIVSEASSMILLYGACDRTLLLAMGHWSSVLHRHR